MRSPAMLPKKKRRRLSKFLFYGILRRFVPCLKYLKRLKYFDYFTLILRYLIFTLFFSLDSGHVQDLHSILFKGERFSRLQYHFVRNENVEYGEYIANIRMQRVKQIYNSCIFSFC